MIRDGGGCCYTVDYFREAFFSKEGQNTPSLKIQHTEFIHQEQSFMASCSMVLVRYWLCAGITTDTNTVTL